VEVTPINQIAAEEVDQTVAVQGTLMDVRSLAGKGYKFVLTDGTGQVALVVWRNVYESLPEPDKLGIGAQVQAQGKVNQYRDELQIVPQDGEDVVIVKEPPTATVIPMDEVTAELTGQWRTVQGEITEVWAFSRGMKARLRDTTGEVVILLWQNIYASLPEPEAISVGTKLQATGQINVFGEELQVVPKTRRDVTVLE
jgi:exonuclease VII large subunit